MDKVNNESKPKINRNSLRLPVPGVYKRERRARKNSRTPRRNDGKKIGSGQYMIGFKSWDPAAIYIPKRKKFKGWQRENRKYRRAA